ncbi:MAG: GTP cyclohydrolase I FolE [Chloroflexi bacterium]|nr:MAG: GTP cyclohydrolase I FolE [Chloroflexota bacterium]
MHLALGVTAGFGGYFLRRMMIGAGHKSSRKYQVHNRTTSWKLLRRTEGYDGDPKLLKVFETECRGGSDCRLSQVIEGPIPFFALCEHHALPFYGLAYIGYIAHEHIIGISKLTRLVRLFAKRFTVQERLGRQIADSFTAMLEPHGVAVYVEAHHLCMQMRGVKETASLTRTTVWRGEYEQNSSLRVEFLLGCGADV